MMGHPRAYWTFPEDERRKQIGAWIAGFAFGVSLPTIAGVLWRLVVA